MARGAGLLAAAACVAAALLAAGCGGAGETARSVRVEHEVEPRPPRVGADATVTLKLSDGPAPVTGARVTLEGNMNHPGMAPVFAGATEVEPGRYRATLEFTMGGDWFVLVRATLADGRRLERQFDVRGVRTN